MGACVSIVSHDGRHPLPEQKALHARSNLPEDPNFDDEADDPRNPDFGLGGHPHHHHHHDRDAAQQKQKSASSSSSPGGAHLHHDQSYDDEQSVRDMRRSSVGLVVDPSVFEDVDPDGPSPGRGGSERQSPTGPGPGSVAAASKMGMGGGMGGPPMGGMGGPMG